MAHKEIQRQNTVDEIKGYARSQMVKNGLAGISMSAIARSMEISSPALYRYFDSRDALVRALIGDALEDFVSSLQKAENGILPTDYAGRFWAVSMEYRNWAQSHPNEFQLIFTNPCSDDPSATALSQQGSHRIFGIIMSILWDAYQGGKLRPLPEDASLLDGIDFGQMKLIGDQEKLAHAPVVYTSLVAWSRFHGLVALELSQAITSQVASRDFIYHQEVAGLMKNIGLEMTQISSQPDREYSKSKIQIGKAHAADDLNVIFGSGPLGLAVMRELLLRGKQVRMIDRTGKAQIPDGVERMVGDAFQVDFTRKACQNAAVVYQCAQPATGIWLERFAPLNAAILDGAAAKGAKFIYGDNLLVYGAVDGPIHEGMANKPQTRKGQVRARVSEAVLTAHRSGRVRAAIGRGSDFFGPNVLDALLGEKFIRTLLQGKTVPMLGDPEMPHTFTYIMDFGKALVELGEREEASGQIWHVPNASTLTQRQLVELFFKEAGIPPKNHSIGRGLLSFKSLFSPDAREKIAVLYQFEKPFIIDSGKFERAFGITATPLAEAVRRTVLWFREYLK